MKRFIVILSLLTISFAQQGEVANVVASQRTDGSHLVDVSYDLLPDDTFITLIGNKIFTLIGNIFFNLNISDILFTYVGGNTNLANKLGLKNESFGFCVELPISIKKRNFSYTSIASHERKRIGGKKKVNAFRDGLIILIEMIKLFFKKN